MTRPRRSTAIHLGVLRLRMDPGKETRLRLGIARPRMSRPLEHAAVEVGIKGGRWHRPARSPHLSVHGEDQVVLLWRAGPFEIRDGVRVVADHLERRLEVRNRSSMEVQLEGVRMLLPDLSLGPLTEGRVEAPATSLRPRLPLIDAIRRGRDDPWDKEIAPSAIERWGRGLEDAPDVTPGLLALHNPRRGVSFLTWYHSETEAATPLMFGTDGNLILGHEVGLAGWLAPGESLAAGTQYFTLVEGDWAAALAAFRPHYARVGILPPIYGTPPGWVPSSAVYEVHPGMYGGFRGLAEALPGIAALGFDVLYLMPVMLYDNRSGLPWDENWLGSGSPYAMKDFEALDPSLGDERDFRGLVAEAHRLGMRVLMDFVPQGCATDARYVTEHPEWFCRDEEGHLVSSHGWIDTYSFDWANPAYQEYMLGWSLRMVRAFGIDGYRVDAPHAKEPNWDRAIPYHASVTSLGVLPLLEQLRRGLLEIGPDKAMLCELFGPVYVRSHDFQYDYHPCVQLHALLRGDLSVQEIGTWFQDYWAVQPPGAVRLTFTETHDTRTQMKAYALRGSAAERAMFAILLLAGFVPMVWSGQERSHEEWYRRVLTARRESPAILSGRRAFNTVSSSNPEVLSIVCQSGTEWVWGLISLYGERAPVRFVLPDAMLPWEAGHHRLFDLIQGQHWSEHGRHAWSSADLRELTLSPEPFVPYFFRLEGV